MGTSVITIRLNSDDKNTFTSMCEEFGMNTSTAINMFVKDCIRRQSILGLPCSNPEPVDENGFTQAEREYLMKSIAQLEHGQVVRYEEQEQK